MQIVLSKNRVIAYGENFLAMGGTVINTETGEKYDNATVAECDCVPSDIGTSGYEYHSGVFVPCAPYGKGNNKGFLMEVCTECATPRNSGVPVKNVKWETVSSKYISFTGGTSNAEPKKTTIVTIPIDTEALSDYTEYRLVLKSGSFLLQEDYTTEYAIPYIDIIANGANCVSISGLASSPVSTPADLILNGGFLNRWYMFNNDSGSSGIEIRNYNNAGEPIDISEISFEWYRCICGIDCTVELQVRG